MPISAAIYGCRGTELLSDEKAFFRDARPLGFILFARNCRSPEQVRVLCASLREAADDAEALILIDQEGGRVARLKPPHWRQRPPARRFGEIFASNPGGGEEAAYLEARLIAEELLSLGITVDCAPVLDVPVKGAHDIIGDRAYSEEVSAVVALGRAAVRGFLDGGVLPVIKHVPGHGRAEADSHEELPRVCANAAQLRAHDFVPFRQLRDAPMAMTAHVVYEKIDTEHPATTSAKIIGEIIRGEIGYDGFLMTDDISMKALEGPVETRANAALSAGCDAVLHCNGRMDEMVALSANVPPLSDSATRRLEAARKRVSPGDGIDVMAAEARLEKMLGAAA